MIMKAATSVLVLLVGTAIGGVVDDFEGYSAGGAPGGIWHDASSFIDNPTNPGPTVSVISTTNAQGNATQAVQISGDNIGTSGGIMGRVDHTNVQRFETDLRLDRAGNGSSPNWISAAGFFQETDQADFNWSPQAMVYAMGNSRRFRLFVQNADGRGGAARDFGLGAHTWEFDTWYRLALEVDTESGVFDVSIINLESGAVLTERTRAYSGWNSEFGQYDLISVNDGEMGTNPGTVGNMATIDNVNYVPAPGSLVALVGAGFVGSRRRRK